MRQPQIATLTVTN